MIPRVQWSLIYEISLFHAVFLEKIPKSIRKWLNIQLDNRLKLLLFYFSCPLLTKSLTFNLKFSKIIGYLLLCDSKHPLASFVSPRLKSAHWKVSSLTQVEVAEAGLRFQKIRRYLHLGQSSFENIKLPPLPEKPSQPYQQLLSKPLSKEDPNLGRALQLQVQCIGYYVRAMY